MKRIAIYVRVSTQEQSCELQLREIQEFVKAKGWEVAKVYEDKATGTNANRSMLKNMLADASCGNFDVIVCWKLDRLFRSLKDLILVLHDLSELKIDFVAIKDNIDLTTSAGRLMMHMMGAFAEFEASLIRSRVKAGLANAKANGTQLGRPYKVSPHRMLELRSTGLSLSEIGIALGVSKSAVSKTLKKLSSEAA
jgi:DNA invertase Pin-like site-specific DNA recombinase